MPAEREPPRGIEDPRRSRSRETVTDLRDLVAHPVGADVLPSLDPVEGARDVVVSSQRRLDQRVRVRGGHGEDSDERAEREGGAHELPDRRVTPCSGGDDRHPATVHRHGGPAP